ncbi:MAG: choice-of-anchor V domain-containing protein [Ignavibacteria bacterium]|jgi:hypothetical protein
MKIRYTISTIAVLLFLVTLYSNLMAFMDGIVGFTKKNGESIGCVCHNLDPNDSVSVRIIGPNSVRQNDTATYILAIANGPAIAGGCDIATSRGSVITTPLDTFLRRAEQFPGAGFELTHKEPKPFNGDTLKFIFRYIAPAAPNTIDTIFANGNSTNNDLGSDNDKWNFAANFLVSITTTGVSSNSSVIAEDFVLEQNYPNPFNPETKINFSLSKSGNVSLKVYDATGKTVANLINNEFRGAGDFEMNFNSANYGLNSGVYFYELRTKQGSAVRKMLIVK